MSNPSSSSSLSNPSEKNSLSLLELLPIFLTTGREIYIETVSEFSHINKLGCRGMILRERRQTSSFPQNSTR